MRKIRNHIVVLLLFMLVGMEFASATVEIPNTILNILKPKIINNVDVGVNELNIEKCTGSYTINSPSDFSSYNSISHEEKSGFLLSKFSVSLEFVVDINIVTSRTASPGVVKGTDPISLEYSMTYTTGTWIFKKTYTEIAKLSYEISMSTKNDVSNETIKFQIIEPSYTVEHILGSGSRTNFKQMFKITVSFTVSSLIKSSELSNGSSSGSELGSTTIIGIVGITAVIIIMFIIIKNKSKGKRR